MDTYTDNCPNCGAPVTIDSDDRAIACEHCGIDLRIMPDGSPVPFFHTAAEHGPEVDQAAIRRELNAGRKINAIKLVRESTSLGLKEALEYVEAIESGEEPDLPPLPPSDRPRPGSGLDEVRALAASGKKIEAIKRYREIGDTSLAEAKEAVEALERGEQIPAFPSREPGSGGGAAAGSGAAEGKKLGRGGCARVLFFMILPFLLICGGCGQVIRGSDLHACAIDAVSSSPDLREMLGTPIELSSFPIVMGYSSETDFGGNTDRSAGYFILARGAFDRTFLVVDAFETSQGFYGVEINPVPNPDDIFITRSGQISECSGE